MAFGRSSITIQAGTAKFLLGDFLGAYLDFVIIAFVVFMIGKGVTSGVATSTEVSAFAVVYALLVGGLAFRELTVASVVRLFVHW